VRDRPEPTEASIDASPDGTWSRALGRAAPAFAQRGVAERIGIAVVAIAAVVVSIRAAPGVMGFLGAALALIMLAIAVVDQRRFIIPNELTAAAAVLGIVYAGIAEPDATQAIAWSVVRGTVLALLFLALRAAYARVRGREGMGLGDVKLAGAGGVWLGWQAIPIAIEIAALSALVALALRHLLGRRRIHAATRLPFGLFLAPAIWLAWLIEVLLDIR
jgi:leader peptidase (prepilin peptidase) / N-methyltransferase